MHITSINKFILYINAKDETKNTEGNQVSRMFLPDERYCIDFSPSFKLEGWKQYDTDQDAHYFGVWVNPVTLKTLTYAEGDWSLVECADKAAYNTQIDSMSEFYGEGYEFKAIDGETGSITEYRQDRATMFYAN